MCKKVQLYLIFRLIHYILFIEQGFGEKEKLVESNSVTE